MTTKDDQTKDCSTCRYASTDKRKKIMSETGFDDQLMFEDADKDETVYTCRAFGPPEGVFVDRLCEHAGKEIGLVPITCSAYAAPVRANQQRLSDLDRRIAEREARAAQREKQR